MRKVIVIQDDKKSAIIFFAIALALFLACIGFYVWNTVRMRSYELDYVKIQGTIVDVTLHKSSGKHSSSYFYVISYTYEGQEYTFTDRTGHSDASGVIGKTTEIFVHPQHPDRAEVVTSAGFASIICAIFFAFFCVTYAAGMNILLSTKGTTFKKRCIFAWGTEVLLGIAFLLLFWLGLPNSGFGEVFARIEGAIGITVIIGLVLLVTLLDGIITYKLRSYNSRH